MLPWQKIVLFGGQVRVCQPSGASANRPLQAGLWGVSNQTRCSKQVALQLRLEGCFVSEATSGQETGQVESSCQMLGRLVKLVVSDHLEG